MACRLDLSVLGSPLPPSQCAANLQRQPNSPELICIPEPVLAADWSGASAVPWGCSTNGGSTAWLTGREQVASLHFSFFSFKQQPLHTFDFPQTYVVFARVGGSQWSAPLARALRSEGTSWIIFFCLCLLLVSHLYLYFFFSATDIWQLLLWTLMLKSSRSEVS